MAKKIILFLTNKKILIAYILAQSNKKLYVSKHQTKEERAAASKNSLAPAKTLNCTKNVSS